MGRGSTKALIRKITSSLAEGPKTIAEIAESSGLDRTAIGSYIAILKESGLLLEEQEGTSKRFTLIPTYRKDTYFGLPLSPEAEMNVNSVYSLIRKYWSEKTDKRLLSTHVQKIVFEVVSSCDNLKIPFGWYLYGGLSIVSYDDSMDYPYTPLSPEVEHCVKETTMKYVDNEFAWQSKQLQYKQENNALYNVKEEILSILYSPKFDSHPKNSLFVMVKKLQRLLKLVPAVVRESYSEILNSYYDLMLDLTNKVDETILVQKKRDITILFEGIWKYIALFNFKKDLEKFYSDRVLNAHFELDVLQQEDELVELGTQLQALVPEDEVLDSDKRKLAEALDSIKKLKENEKDKQKAVLDKLKSELGEKKFQEWLFEQAGL